MSLYDGKRRQKVELSGGGGLGSPGEVVAKGISANELGLNPMREIPGSWRAPDFTAKLELFLNCFVRGLS